MTDSELKDVKSKWLACGVSIGFFVGICAAIAMFWFIINVACTGCVS
jgi:hypothetical protein